MPEAPQVPEWLRPQLQQPLAALQKRLRDLVPPQEQHRVVHILQLANDCLKQRQHLKGWQAQKATYPGLPTPEQLLGHLLEVELRNIRRNAPATEAAPASAIPTAAQGEAAAAAAPADQPAQSGADELSNTAGATHTAGCHGASAQEHVAGTGSAAPAAGSSTARPAEAAACSPAAAATNCISAAAAVVLGSAAAAGAAPLPHDAAAVMAAEATDSWGQPGNPPPGPCGEVPPHLLMHKLLQSKRWRDYAQLKSLSSIQAAACKLQGSALKTATSSDAAANSGDSNASAPHAAGPGHAPAPGEAGASRPVSGVQQSAAAGVSRGIQRPAALGAPVATESAASAPPVTTPTTADVIGPSACTMQAAASGAGVSAPTAPKGTGAPQTAANQARGPNQSALSDKEKLALLLRARMAKHKQMARQLKTTLGSVPVYGGMRNTRPIDALRPISMKQAAAEQDWLLQQRQRTWQQLAGSHQTLGSLFSASTTQAAQRQAATAQQRKGLISGVTQWHVEAAAEAKRKREEAMRQRLAALKSSDMAAYLNMIRTTANSKVQQLLLQTDSCFKSLAQKLEQAGLQLDASAVTQEATEEPDGCEGPMADGVLGSSAVWSRLAQQLMATGVEQQPQALTGGQLREYQMQGLCWMVGLVAHGLNGILADEMGLGKTVQVVALICHLVEVSKVAGRYLICCPASVLPNWAAELKRWAPSLKVVVYKGTTEAREDIYYKQVSGKSFQVLLTTYDYLMSKHDRPRLSRLPWQLLVVDEGHRLKNADCKLSRELKAYRTKSRLLLTGTPLQNKLEELWALLNFLMPDLFHSADDFDVWFGAPLQAIRESFSGAGGAQESEAALLSQEEYLLVTNRLHHVLRPFVLRRLKESMAQELPDKREVLLRCPLSAYQQLLMDLVKQKLTNEDGEVCKAKGVNNIAMELRNICNHPYISRLHPEHGEDVLASCSTGLPHMVRICGKLLMLDQVLLRMAAGRHKVLLFSTMTRALDMVEEHLEWRGWEYLRLDGGVSSAERGDMVDKFNDPDSGVFLFLLSIRAGGVGLNLQAADTVIMYDSDWNPQIDLQAQARAHRIGQQREVLVVRLLAQNTIEEHVLKVAEEKRKFADSSITGGFFDGKTSQEQRREFLLSILQNGGPSSSSSAADLSPQQLNQLLARSPAESDLLNSKTAVWAAAAGGPQAASRTLLPLLTAPECQPLMDLAAETAAPKPKEDMSLFGKGMRGLKMLSSSTAAPSASCSSLESIKPRLRQDSSALSIASKQNGSSRQQQPRKTASTAAAAVAPTVGGSEALQLPSASPAASAAAAEGAATAYGTVSTSKGGTPDAAGTGSATGSGLDAAAGQELEATAESPAPAVHKAGSVVADTAHPAPAPEAAAASIPAPVTAAAAGPAPTAAVAGGPAVAAAAPGATAAEAAGKRTAASSSTLQPNQAHLPTSRQTAAAQQATATVSSVEATPLPQSATGQELQEAPATLVFAGAAPAAAAMGTAVPSSSACHSPVSVAPGGNSAGADESPGSSKAGRPACTPTSPATAATAAAVLEPAAQEPAAQLQCSVCQQQVTTQPLEPGLGLGSSTDDAAPGGRPSCLMDDEGPAGLSLAPNPPAATADAAVALRPAAATADAAVAPSSPAATTSAILEPSPAAAAAGADVIAEAGMPLPAQNSAPAVPETAVAQAGLQAQQNQQPSEPNKQGPVLPEDPVPAAPTALPSTREGSAHAQQPPPKRKPGRPPGSGWKQRAAAGAVAVKGGTAPAQPTRTAAAGTAAAAAASKDATGQAALRGVPNPKAGASHRQQPGQPQKRGPGRPTGTGKKQRAAAAAALAESPAAPAAADAAAEAASGAHPAADQGSGVADQEAAASSQQHQQHPQKGKPGLPPGSGKRPAVADQPDLAVRQLPEGPRAVAASNAAAGPLVEVPAAKQHRAHTDGGTEPTPAAAAAAAAAERASAAAEVSQVEPQPQQLAEADAADRHQQPPPKLIKGVYWRADRKRWVVELKRDGKTRYEGSFKSKEEAQARYDACMAAYSPPAAAATPAGSPPQPAAAAAAAAAAATTPAPAGAVAPSGLDADAPDEAVPLPDPAVLAGPSASPRQPSRFAARVPQAAGAMPSSSLCLPVRPAAATASGIHAAGPFPGMPAAAPGTTIVCPAAADEQLLVIKGIMWRADRRKWTVRFEWHGSRYYKGCFCNLQEAEAALEECLAENNIKAVAAHVAAQQRCSPAAAAQPAGAAAPAPAAGAGQRGSSAAAAAIARAGRGGRVSAAPSIQSPVPAPLQSGNHVAHPSATPEAAAAGAGQCIAVGCMGPTHMAAAPSSGPLSPSTAPSASAGSPTMAAAAGLVVLGDMATSAIPELCRPVDALPSQSPPAAQARQQLGQGHAQQVRVVKGIHWRSDRRKWVVRFEWEGSRYYKGCFSNLQEAQAALEECLAENNIQAVAAHVADRAASGAMPQAAAAATAAAAVATATAAPAPAAAAAAAASAVAAAPAAGLDLIAAATASLVSVLGQAAGALEQAAGTVEQTGDAGTAGDGGTAGQQIDCDQEQLLMHAGLAAPQAPSEEHAEACSDEEQHNAAGQKRRRPIGSNESSSKRQVAAGLAIGAAAVL